MKILVVCQYYYPEPFRIHEVCEGLAKRGHNVTVLTGLPNYPMGVIPDEYKNGQHRDEVVNGVHIIRVNEIPRTPGKVGLAKNYVSFVFNGCIKALFMKKDFDVIFVYQLSPVLMAIPGFVAKWFSRTKYLALYCLDLWPESLVSLGISKTSFFFKFMKWVSRRIYSGARKIGFTSQMFINYFENDLSIRDDKFTYIPQFADELFSDVSSGDKENGSVMNYVFAGNIGEMQSVETIIRAAALTKTQPVKWHIVGDGLSYEKCKKLAQDLEVSDNLIFYGRLPVEDMPRFYKMADAMIVTLADSEIISYTLPGKVQSYMAAGKPIIGCANGETGKVIEESSCGLCAKAEDEQGLAEIAVRMINEDRVKMGLNSRNYYEKHFSKRSHIDNIEALLKQCVG